MKSIAEKKAIVNEVAWYFFHGLDDNPDLVTQGLNELIVFIDKEEDREFKDMLQRIYDLAFNWKLDAALEVIDTFLAL